MTTSQPRTASAQSDFDALLAAHLPALTHLALRYTRNASKADDLVHDTAVRALRFRDTFRQGSNFKAWAYTILTNTFIHHYRRSRKEHELLRGARRLDVIEELRSPAQRTAQQQPELAMLAGQLSDDVVAALAALPEEFRAVVVACDLQGQRYRDVAEALGCPMGTVMSRLYRGRRLLGERLSDFARAQGIGRKSRAA